MVAAIAAALVGPALADEPAASSDELRVVVEAGGDLTIDARDVALVDLIAEIAEQTGLAYTLFDAGQARVSVVVEGLSLTEALGRILRSSSYMLIEAPKPGGPARLWLFGDLATPVQGGGVTEGSSLGAAVSSASAQSSGYRVDAPADAESARFRRQVESIADLAERGEPGAAATLAGSLGDSNAAVRAEAVRALAEIGDDTSVGLLRQALADANAAVRESAVEAFADIGGDAAADALAIALADVDPEVREEAIYALGDIGGAGAATLLARARHDADPRVREAAALLLGEIDAGEADP